MRPSNSKLGDARALYTSAELRAIERKALADLPEGTLMQRAGEAAADKALSLISQVKSNSRILAIAGPGNNGGDACEAAWRLAESGLQVTVLDLSEAGSRLSPEARQARARLKQSAARHANFSAADDIFAASWDLVIDGLFGIGLTRPLTGIYSAVIEAINALDCPVLALDIPSGLNADTGCIVGGGNAICATHTISFIGDKPGLHTGHGRDLAGTVEVENLGIGNSYFSQAHAVLNGICLFSHHFKQRLHNTHKGSYGDVAIIGGASGMQGAPILSGRTALKCGAGRVHVGFLDQAPAYDAIQPELMCRQAHEIDFLNAVLVCGPGLGTLDAARDVLIRTIASTMPLVLDADALNLIACSRELKDRVSARQSGTLATPHPLEAARLLGIKSGEVQADRPAASRALASLLNAVIVLKGSGTVVAHPNGEIVINATGNPALATAGTGDVLAGLCGALLAQKFPLWEAALAAVWVHGTAADRLVNQGLGPTGLAASELIPEIRNVLNRLNSSPLRPNL